jgi:hypothetical protein
VARRSRQGRDRPGPRPASRDPAAGSRPLGNLHARRWTPTRSFHAHTPDGLRRFSARWLSFTQRASSCSRLRWRQRPRQARGEMGEIKPGRHADLVVLTTDNPKHEIRATSPTRSHEVSRARRHAAFASSIGTAITAAVATAAPGGASSFSRKGPRDLPDRARRVRPALRRRAQALGFLTAHGEPGSVIVDPTRLRAARPCDIVGDIPSRIPREPLTRTTASASAASSSTRSAAIALRQRSHARVACRQTRCRQVSDRVCAVERQREREASDLLVQSPRAVSKSGACRRR